MKAKSADSRLRSILLSIIICSAVSWSIFSANAASERLVVAIESRDVEELQKAIKSGADVNIRDEEGMTPLMSIHGDSPAGLNMARLLLKAGAKLNATDRNGTTPLTHAVRNNDIDLVKLLIRAGASVDTKDNEGKTALMYIRRGETEMLNALLKGRVNIFARDKLGNTVLHHLEHSQSGEYSLTDDPIYKILARKGLRASPSDKIMGEPSYKEMLQALRAGAKGDLNGHLYRIANEFRYDDWGSEIRLNYFQLLIKYGADVNTEDSDGMTPLMVMISKLPETAAKSKKSWQEFMGIARTFLHSGFNIDHTDKAGRTLLMLIVSKPLPAELAELALKRGTDIEVADSEGRTALFYLARAYAGKHSKHLIENLKLLLKSGVQTRKLDDRGYTAFLSGVENGLNTEVLNNLYETGVNLEMRGYDNCSAADLAFLFEHDHVAMFLKDKGARIAADQTLLCAIQHEKSNVEHSNGFMFTMGGSERTIDYYPASDALIFRAFSLKPNPNAVSAQKESALSLAAKRCRADWMAKLIRRGAQLKSIGGGDFFESIQLKQCKCYLVEEITSCGIRCNNAKRSRQCGKAEEVADGLHYIDVKNK